MEPLASADLPPSDDSATRQWLVRLGGHVAVSLHLRSHAASQAAERLVLARQSSRYSLTNAGLEYQTTLNLSVPQQSLERLLVDVDASLSMIAARLGGKDINFRRDASDRSGGRVCIDFPEPLTGAEREVVLTAFSPLIVEANWRLPAIRPVNVIWQEGNATLDIPDTLLVKRLTPHEGSKPVWNRCPAHYKGNRGSCSLQARSVDRRDPRLRTRESECQLRDDAADGSHVDLRSLRGRYHPFSGKSVCARRANGNGLVRGSSGGSPPDLLDSVAPWSLRGRRLRIRLRHGIPSGQSVKLTISAHRHVAALPVSGRDLRMLDLVGARPVRADLVVPAGSLPPNHCA